MRKTKKIILGLLLVATTLVACSTVPISGRSRLDLVSNDAVLANSFAAYNEYIATAPKSRNVTQTQRVNEIGRRIAQATDAYLRAVGLGAEADKYRWEFNLIASDKINAFCMPGGKIVVYEGILPFTDNDHQLATIVAHEVAHAVAKHSNERMSQELLRRYGARVLSGSLSGKSVALQQVAGTLYGLGTNVLYTLPYSRKHEYEADIIGLYLMALAGYDYTQAENFWLNMSALGGSSNDFLSTHPSDKKRIEAIRAEIPKVRAFMEGTPEQRQKQAPTIPAGSSQLNPDINKGRKVPLKTHY